MNIPFDFSLYRHQQPKPSCVYFEKSTLKHCAAGIMSTVITHAVVSMFSTLIFPSIELLYNKILLIWHLFLFIASLNLKCMYLQQKSSSASQTEKIKTMLDDSSRKLFKSPKLNLKKNKTKKQTIAPETIAGGGKWQPLREEGWVHGDVEGRGREIWSRWKHARFSWPFAHLP